MFSLIGLMLGLILGKRIKSCSQKVCVQYVQWVFSLSIVFSLGKLSKIKSGKTLDRVKIGLGCAEKDEFRLLLSLKSPWKWPYFDLLTIFKDILDWLAVWKSIFYYFRFSIQLSYHTIICLSRIRNHDFIFFSTPWVGEGHRVLTWWAYLCRTMAPINFWWNSSPFDVNIIFLAQKLIKLSVI